MKQPPLHSTVLVRLPPELRLAVQAEARRQSTTVSELVRAIVRSMLEKARERPDV